MTTAALVFDQILPRWREVLPSDVPRPYFDQYVVRNRSMLIDLIGAWLGRREERRAISAPESMTPAARTRRNLAAMRLVATKRPEDMTADERRTLLGYSGWGGLSIEGVMDQFPPGLVPSDFALAHEFFTPTPITREVADLVCPLLPELAGYDGIVRGFEPSVGIGRFVREFGPPRCLLTDPRYKSIHWTAVELSEVSAKMFAAMRPDVDLYVMSLEQWMSEHAARYQGTLSLIVANPPFGGRGEFALKDKHPAYQEPKAYAYFMLRCSDLLVPRGVAVFIIPAGYLTGTQNRKLRERMLLRHHLEVAFRLPSESSRGKDLFPGARNVVDVLVWRARGGELGAVDEADQYILEGRYFDEHPDHILGTEIKVDPAQKNKRDRYRVVGDFTGFPAYTPRTACRTCALHDLPTLTAVQVESVVRDLGDDAEDAEGDLRHALALGRRVDRYLALVAAENTKAINLWSELHEALRSFKRLPTLHAQEGNPWRWPELQHLAKRKPAAARLLAAYQRTGELAPSVATAPNIQPKYRARPDDVLAQAEHLHRAKRRLNTTELLAFHREQGGRMDARTALAAVLGAGWCLDGEGWDELVPGADYVTGRLWPRYDLAAARAASDPQAARQLQRLQTAMNLAVFEDIRDVSPRQGWVPLDLVSTWLGEGPNREYGPAPLVREGGIVHPAGARYGAIGRTDALTPDALWFIGWVNHDAKLFKPKLEDDAVKALIAEEEAATGRPWRLEKDDPNERDKERDEDDEDDDADDDDDDPNLGELRLLLGRRWDRQFAAWVAASAARRVAVTDAYNRAFRGTVIPKFEASTLEIARWNEHGPQLKAHQIAGALRINHFGFGLVAFDVGVGKSFTAIAGVALARQEGRVRRPVFLVPSSLVWQWYDNFMCVLPDYRVAVIGSKRKQLTRGKNRGQITSEPDTPEERAEKWTALQAGLLDVVILSYDALGRTKMNEEALVEYVEKIGAIQRQVALRQRNARKKAQSKLSEREKAILNHGVRAFIEQQIELPPDRKYDPGIAWDEIGIDMLVVDEAAAFKNSYKPEPREHGMPKYMGSSRGSSKRAWQLDFRAAAVRRHTKGTGIVLLTATPAKNSPLEFYNLIQLMDPWAFSGRGLMDPEQFIDRFLQIESRQIIDVTLRPATRSVVAGFKNLDDLRTIIHTYGEFRSAEQVHLKIPEPRSELVRVSMNAEQEHLYGRLVRKINDLLAEPGFMGGRSKILGLLVRLSVVALHPELDGGVEYDEALSSVDPDAYAAPKLLACADRIAASAGCGHIVFCEPTAVHLWLREVLVARGIPRETIAILNAIETTPAQRNRIAREFNGVAAEAPAGGACQAATTEYTRPRYNVIIANSVANEGLDLQRRTCAMHHLDLPWTSADLEQRNGRGVRQGNELDVVQIYYYLTDRSMDWFRYSTIQGKRAWLSAVLESQARDTSNPGAQQNLSDEDILMMISRDPEATRAALERRRAAAQAIANAKIAREAANLLIQASARFRDARDTADPEKAARLRGEGDVRLKDIRRVDVAAWPWGKWADHAREVEVLVASADAAPVFEGLRVGQGPPAERRFLEFGRVVEGERGVEIGKRDHGAPLWQLLDTTDVRDLRLEPAELDAGSEWPAEDEADLLTALQSHITRTLVDGAPLSALQWRGASDAWLSRWWPRVEPQIRGALATRPERPDSPLVRTKEDDADEPRYPLVVGDRLLLAAGPALRRGELIAPTLAGWRRYLQLAPPSGLRRGELREVAAHYWERPLPRGLALAAGDTAGDVDVAPVRRVEALLPAPAAPIPARQVPLTWADKVIARFNQAPGYTLRLVRRSGQDQHVFAVEREGRADDVVASIDVAASEVEDVRWLDPRVRSAEQTDIVDRLAGILADLQAEESAAEEDPPPDAGSLDPLIRMLERIGGERLGMDVRRTLRGASTQTLGKLSAELQDLSVPTTESPASIAEWLREIGLFDAAEVLEDPAKLAYSSISALLDELWSAIDGDIPLAQIQRKGGAAIVTADAIRNTLEVGDYVLVREDGKDRRYRLRRVPVQTSECDRESCTLTERGARLTRGTDVYLDRRDEPFITVLHDRVGSLEDTLRRAPALLADVRSLLVLTGALVDTQRCQGKEQAAALRAFEQAKAYHDAARRLLIEGKTAVAAERIHNAMRRITTAAAHIAQNCAAGQQDIVPATLPVTPDDAATLEEV
ncbi:MAG: hypothetical protein JNL82_17505 [Myxococcales bacterium]|nr:hypothetical protein [Myxococcales bacterium]